MFPGNPCQFRTSNGCGIYASRPDDPCKEFICAWLQKDSPLPESMRPDQVGVIVISNLRWKKWTVIKAVATGGRIPATSMDWLRRHAMKSKKPLVFKEFEQSGTASLEGRIRGFGPPEFEAAVRNDLDQNNGA